MNEQLAARRIGRAIFELDNALWHLSGPPKGEMEGIRLHLWRVMQSLGYEFAKSDSPAVRMKEKPWKLIYDTTMHLVLAPPNKVTDWCVRGPALVIPRNTEIAEVILKKARGARGSRWLIRVVHKGKDYYGWLDKRNLFQSNTNQ